MITGITRSAHSSASRSIRDGSACTHATSFAPQQVADAAEDAAGHGSDLGIERGLGPELREHRGDVLPAQPLDERGHDLARRERSVSIVCRREVRLARVEDPLGHGDEQLLLVREVAVDGTRRQPRLLDHRGDRHAPVAVSNGAAQGGIDDLLATRSTMRVRDLGHDPQRRGSPSRSLS